MYAVESKRLSSPIVRPSMEFKIVIGAPWSPLPDKMKTILVGRTVGELRGLLLA